MNVCFGFAIQALLTFQEGVHDDEISIANYSSNIVY